MDKRAGVDARAEWRVQAFCHRQNLGAGGIHFRRACERNRGPHGACPVGCYGGPAADSVKQQIANIKAFVEAREHE